jgi:O-antigen ligase
MLSFNTGAMVITMALCVFTTVMLLGGVNPALALPSFILTGVVVVSWLFRRFSSTRVRDGDFWASYAVIVFCAYSTIRYLWSVPEYSAREDLFSVFLSGLFFLISAHGLGFRQARTIFIFGLMGMALFESGYAAWQAFSKADSVLFWERPEGYNGRGSGTFICPNHLAGFLEMALGLVVARVVFLRKESNSLEKTTTLKVVTIYVALMIAGGLVVTLSRAGWASTVVGMVALLFLGGIKLRTNVAKLAMLVGILACAGGLLWSLAPIRNYLLKSVVVTGEPQILRLGDPTIGGRTMMWSGTLKIIRDEPLFGTGMGSWRWAYQKYKDYRILSFPEYTHNDYLNLISDYGLVGGALMLMVFVCFFRHAFRVMRTSRNSEEQAFGAGAIVAVVCILFHSWFDFGLHILGNSMLLALIMGLTAAISVGNSERSSRPKEWLSRSGIVVAVLGMAAVAFYFYVPTLRAYHLTEKGHGAKADLKHDESIPLLRKAIAIDPKYPKPLVKLGDISRELAIWRVGPTKLKERRELAQQAVISYERALALNPFHTEVWVSKAQAHALSGDDAAALGSFAKAIEVAPVNPYAHFALGRFYSDRGEDEKALDAFNKANLYFLYNEPMFHLNIFEEQEKIKARQGK